MATGTVVEPNGEALVHQPATPMEMIALAISQNADIEKLSKLMDLQERWEKGEARKAFVAAMSAFKSHAIQVLKDKTNKQYDSKYVSLGNLVATVTPFLSQHGLSTRWDIDQTNGIKVSCIITHTAGHSESVSMVLPPDKSGAKNPIQEIKSAVTYGKACTFESICGLASTDANLDDDGNGAGKMTNGELAEQVEELGRCETLDGLEAAFKAAATKALDSQDMNAYTALKKAKDARKKGLK